MMEKQFSDDLDQIKSMEAELNAKRNALYKDVVAKIQEMVTVFNVKASDIKFPNQGTDRRSTIAPKYQNPHGHETWTGRGRAPVWFTTAEAEGYSREDMLIKK